MKTRRARPVQVRSGDINTANQTPRAMATTSVKSTAMRATQVRGRTGAHPADSYREAPFAMSSYRARDPPSEPTKTDPPRRERGPCKAGPPIFPQDARLRRARRRPPARRSVTACGTHGAAKKNRTPPRHLRARRRSRDPLSRKALRATDPLWAPCASPSRRQTADRSDGRIGRAPSPRDRVSPTLPFTRCDVPCSMKPRLA